MVSRYGRVWGAPYVPALLVSSILGRLPLGIVSLALVLFVEDVKGSFAAAGAVTAAFALTAAMLAPFMGRLIDRRGQTIVLVAGVWAHATAVVGVVALGLADAPVWALAACAAAAGTMPPVSACLRPLWPDLLGGERSLLTAAYAVDSILVEVVFVIGPLTVGLVVAVASPQAALLVGAALAATGTLWFAAQPPSRSWRGEAAASAHRAGPLIAPGMRTVVAGAMTMGLCFGALEVALAAYGDSRGTPSLAGVLIALQAVGSAVGGLWYGVRGEQLGGGLHRHYLLLLIAFPCSIVLLAFAPSLGVIVPLAALSGCVIAPLTSATNLLIKGLAPVGTLTEAFTWFVTAIVAGAAVGNAAAGIVVEASSWRVAILGACGAALGGAAVALARRRTLTMAPG